MSESAVHMACKQRRYCCNLPHSSSFTRRGRSREAQALPFFPDNTQDFIALATLPTLKISKPVLLNLITESSPNRYNLVYYRP